DRRRQHPNPRRRAAVAHLHAARNRRGRSPPALRVLPRGAGIRYAAARRHRARRGSHRRDPVRRIVHPRGDRVPEDGERDRPDVGRAVAGRGETAEGTPYHGRSETAEMKRTLTVPEEGIETLFGSYDENLKHLESLFNVRIRTQGHDLLVEGETPDL